MPRPKRSKVAPSAPTMRVAALKTAPSRALTSSVSSSRATTNSDDSEGLVRTRRGAAKSKALGAQEASMSGALAPDDTQSTRPRATKKEVAALSQIARDADHARMIKERILKRNTGPVQSTGDKILVPSSQPSTVGNRRASSAEKGLEDEMCSSEQARKRSRPNTTSLAPTPRIDSSVLGMAKFKRRPRQPSILRTGRRDTLDQGNYTDLEDFQPDDESTPLVLHKPQSYMKPTSLSSPSSQELPGSSSRKRKLARPEVQVPESQTTQQQEKSAIHHTYHSDSDLYGVSSEAEADPEVEEPTLPPIRRTPTPPSQPQSETMASPQSSSPQKSPLRHSTKPREYFTTTIGAPAKTKVTSTRNKKKDPALPKPMTTETLQNLLPRRRNRQKRRAGADNPGNEFDIHVTSSEHEADAETINSEDELSFHGQSARRKKKKNIQQPGIRKQSKSTQKARGKRVTNGPLTKSQQPAETSKTTKPKPGKTAVMRTYTRRASDKENLIDDDDSPRVRSADSEEEREESSNDPSLPEAVPPHPHTSNRSGARGDKASAQNAKTTTIGKLAAKFREVDQWALEFETVTASSSSPRDAR
ncbi:hypothetical protein MMC09_002689 [Bachmanniomyces sp. S44760]|nr:hypothetical protein [Bachmanniomyces sp. S44760]